MLNKIRDYLDFAGLQYRNPDKAGEEREKMLEFRHKRSRGSKSLYRTGLKLFQISHPEWQLQQTSQWMNQAQRLRPHFLGLSTERRTSDRTYDGLTFVRKFF